MSLLLLLGLLPQVGVDWTDRVARERASPPERALDYGGDAGARALLSDNVFKNASDEGRGREADLGLLAYVDGFARLSADEFEAGAWAMADYTVHTESSSLNDFQFRSLVSGDWKGRRTALTLSNAFRKESDPDHTLFIDRIERVSDDLFLRASHDLSERLGLDALAGLQYVDIRRSTDTGDNTTPIVQFGTRYEYAEDAFAFLHAEARWIDYRLRSQTDVDIYTVRGGVRGSLTARLRGSAGVGWFFQRGDDKDADGPAASADLSYEFSERTYAQLQASREATYSLNGEYQIASSVRMVASHDVAENVRVRVSVSYSEIHVIGAPDSSDFTARVDGAWTVTPLLSVTAGCSFQRTSRTPGFDFFEDIVYVGVNYQLGRPKE